MWRDAAGQVHGVIGSAFHFDAAGFVWYLDAETGQINNAAFDIYSQYGYWESADCTGERFLFAVVQPRIPIRVQGPDAGYWVRPDGQRTETVIIRSNRTGGACTVLTQPQSMKLLRVAGFQPIAGSPPALPDVGPLHMEKIP